MSQFEQDKISVPKKKEWTRRSTSGRMSARKCRKRERVLNKCKRIEALQRVPT